MLLRLKHLVGRLGMLGLGTAGVVMVVGLNPYEDNVEIFSLLLNEKHIGFLVVVVHSLDRKLQQEP